VGVVKKDLSMEKGDFNEKTGRKTIKKLNIKREGGFYKV